MRPSEGLRSLWRLPTLCARSLARPLARSPARPARPPRLRAPPPYAAPPPRAAAGRRAWDVVNRLAQEGLEPGSSVIVMALLTEMVVEGVVRWRASSSRTASPPPACDAVANFVAQDVERFFVLSMNATMVLVTCGFGSAARARRVCGARGGFWWSGHAWMACKATAKLEACHHHRIIISFFGYRPSMMTRSSRRGAHERKARSEAFGTQRKAGARGELQPFFAATWAR